ncbi:MAG: hypothetical protein FJ405_18505, partial [Verrucomicrobia bacterium]|nr:hypothetical protein [Verrucomicrobiota bacterium]
MKKNPAEEDAPPEPLIQEDSRRAAWRSRITPLLNEFPTPFFLFATEPIEAGLEELTRAFEGIPITHWLSVKTQPLPALLRWWNAASRPVEVVSGWELKLALQCGVPSHRLLVNGPAKHHWLPEFQIEGLHVHLDSPAEAGAIAPIAAKRRWKLGLRCCPMSEFDPETPRYPSQFGMSGEELASAVRILAGHRLAVESLHFHLRTNVARAEVYRTAISEVMAMAEACGVRPAVLDIGGGMPARHVRGMRGWNVDQNFSVSELSAALKQALVEHPSLKEIWMENGRWLLADSGVLAVRILDVKERRGMRSLICDGGRTLNAMPSCWEQHDMTSIPLRTGPCVMTTVNGPTCMAFDKLARGQLPGDLAPGDV